MTAKRRLWRRQVVLCGGFLASIRGKGKVTAIHPGQYCKPNCKHFPCVAVRAELASEKAVRAARQPPPMHSAVTRRLAHDPR